MWHNEGMFEELLMMMMLLCWRTERLNAAPTASLYPYSHYFYCAVFKENILKAVFWPSHMVLLPFCDWLLGGLSTGCWIGTKLFSNHPICFFLIGVIELIESFKSSFPRLYIFIWAWRILSHNNWVLGKWMNKEALKCWKMKDTRWCKSALMMHNFSLSSRHKYIQQKL